MSRLFLSRHASNDLDDIRRYLDSVSELHTRSLRHSLRRLIQEIGAHPMRGTIHSEATRLLGQEVRTRFVSPYRLFYRDTSRTPEIVAILHTARDVSSILSERLQ